MKTKRLLFACTLSLGTAAAFAQSQAPDDHYIEPTQAPIGYSAPVPQTAREFAPLYNGKSHDKGLESGNLRLLGTRGDGWSDIESAYLFEDSTAYIYDVNTGHEQVYISREYNPVTEEWDNYYRRTSAYDVSGWRISQVTEYWNGVSWYGSDKDLYVNDASGRVLENIDYTWSGGMWVLDQRYTYTYDGNGNQLERVLEDWNVGLMAWEPNDRDVYTFDANNNQLTSMDYLVSGGVFVENTLYTYTYDAQGNQLSQLDQDWDAVNSVWENDGRSTYTYLSGNRYATGFYETWDNVGMVWNPTGTDTTTYVSNTSTNIYKQWNGSAYENSARYVKTVSMGNTMFESYEYWDNVGMVWYGSYRTNYTYANGLETGYIYESWDAVNNVWIFSSRAAYFYDSNENPESNVYQYWIPADSAWAYDYRYFYEYNNQNYLTYDQYEFWSNSNSTWTLSDRTFYYYGNKPVVGLEEQQDYQLSVYPNPASEVINISLMLAESQPLSISLLNLEGKTVASESYGAQNGNVYKSFSVNSLAAGNYILRVTAGENSILRKVVVN